MPEVSSVWIDCKLLMSIPTWLELGSSNWGDCEISNSTAKNLCPGKEVFSMRVPLERPR